MDTMYYSGWFPTYVQTLPILSAIQWWIRFYVHLILDPRGCSLYDIFTNPRYSDCKTQSRAIISRRTRRQFLAKGKHKIVPTNASYIVAFSYQVRGAYAYLGTSSHADSTEAIQAASKTVHFDDPLHLSVPYNYQASRLRELPDNTFTRAIDMSHLRPTLLSLCQRDILVHVVLGRRAVLEPSTIWPVLMMMTPSQVDVPPPW